MMDALSDVMNTKVDIIDIAKEKSNIPNKILNQIDKIIDKLSEASKEEDSIRIQTSNIGGLLTKTPTNFDDSTTFDFHTEYHARGRLVEKTSEGENIQKSLSRETGKVIFTGY